MDTKISELKENFLTYKSILDNAREVLKTEFFGIDKVIDEVINNVSSWLIFNDMQSKPFIINLWGLTGVGKTALISRLAELIKFDDRHFRFDLGKKSGSFSFSYALDELCESKDESPLIIVLDEFQHARTILENGKEIDKDENRMVWELIDSGSVQYFTWKGGVQSFEDYIGKLYYLIKAGVKVKDGIVQDNSKLFNYEGGNEDKEGEQVRFVEEYRYSDIIKFAGPYLNINLLSEVQEILLKMNGEETLDFLYKVAKIAKRPSIKNLSKSLIFILGNLDEAYTMGSNFSVEISANEFYQESLKITIPKIKNSLKQRFRDEQIARLGNIHVIYPALSEQAYKQIIKKEIKGIASKMFDYTNLIFRFDSSINDLIYQEGVYPTQGARPIFTSVNQIIRSNMSFFLSEVFVGGDGIDQLHFSAKDGFLYCNYYNNEAFVSTLKVRAATNLEDIRKMKQDDMQAITAVHESGHAVIAAMLLNIVPEVVYSVTADADNAGFVYTKSNTNYISRKEIIPRVAMMLGGYAAEELVFGKDQLTAGAESDIDKATNFLSVAYLLEGMGKTPIRYSIPTTTSMLAYHKTDNVEEEIRQAIEKALLLAKETLKKELKLFLAMADFLSDNRTLKKEEIEAFIIKYSTGLGKIEESKGDVFYRKQLKRKASETMLNNEFCLLPALVLNKEDKK